MEDFFLEWFFPVSVQYWVYIDVDLDVDVNFNVHFILEVCIHLYYNL